jgi:hypothetical protein
MTLVGVGCAAWALGIGFGSGCGAAGDRTVIDVSDVKAASGAPSVRSAVDLGDVALPQHGALPAAEGDGRLAIGELVLVDGDDFGKQPAVVIGGRPAEILARTGGGGIVTRVPRGVPSGAIQIEVSHPGGHSAIAATVQRQAIVVQRGKAVYAVNVDGAGAASDEAPQQLPLAGAGPASFSPDGASVLVAVDGGADGGEPEATVAVLSAVARGGLRRVYTVRPGAGQKPRALAVAAAAPVGALVDEQAVTLLDLEDARQPAPFAPLRLEGAARIVAAALDSRGGRLALLDGERNQVLLYDVSPRGNGDGSGLAPAKVPMVELLPGERLPLAIDLGFAPDGSELWVLCGDRGGVAAAAGTGAQPARLVVVGVEGGAATARRTVNLSGLSSGGAVAPRGLALAPLEGGAPAFVTLVAGSADELAAGGAVALPP